jgi:hypothetical protein
MLCKRKSQCHSFTTLIQICKDECGTLVL